MNMNKNENSHEEIIIENIDRTDLDDRREKRMMANLERINACMRVGEADMEKMSELLERMKGPGRSYNQYAKDIGVAASTLTRISKQEVSSVSNELLAKLAEHMNPDCGVTIEDLVRANGLREDERRSYMMQARKFEQDAEAIVSKDLYRANKMVMRVDYSKYNRKSFGRIAVDFVIKTNIDEHDDLWAFSVRYVREKIEGTRSINTDSHFVAMRMLEQISAIMSEFYCGTNIKKWSIVLNREEVFDDCIDRIKKRLDGTRIKDKISLILVDSEQGYVTREWTLPTYEGDEDETLFPCKPEEFKKSDGREDEYLQYDIFNMMYTEGSDDI